MNKKFLIVGSVVGLGVAWAVFRPELIFLDKRVDESLPEATASGGGAMRAAQDVLLCGEFYSVAHETKGTATIHRLDDGQRVLRLSGFETSNGPDVRVLLVGDAMPKDNDVVKGSGFVEIAKLKGNVGDQNYELPENVDLAKYRAVTIWCNRFGVNFGSAPLAAPSA